jgi:uncharacterized protein YndB with AHSA1/START domain
MTPLDPDRDLELTRLMAVPPATVWRCWTEPELLKRWFTPHPVITRHAEIDLRPGGRFFTIMVMPDGTEMPNYGSYLEVEHERRLTFTDTLEAGFRPAPAPGLGFTAMLTFAPEAGGTRYTARAMHRDRAVCESHAKMGFHEGWGTAAAQLETVARGLL